MGVAGIDFDSSLLRSHEGEKQTDESGFSDTSLAQHSGATAGRKIEVEIFEDGSLFVAVGITHSTQTHAAGRGQEDGIALLFERVFFEFHQSFGSGENSNEGGGQLREIPGRPLDAVDELEEGRHSAEAQGVMGEPDSGPEESHEVAQGKPEVEHEVGEHREDRPPHHMPAQFALGVAQFVYHDRSALESFDEHSVLDGFL